MRLRTAVSVQYLTFATFVDLGRQMTNQQRLGTLEVSLNGHPVDKKGGRDAPCALSCVLLHNPYTC